MATTKTTKAKGKATKKEEGAAGAGKKPATGKKANTRATAAPNGDDPKPSAAAETPTRKARAGAKPKAGDALGPSMEELAELYLLHLEQIGKSRGTVFSYSIDLAVAVRELGKETRLKTLTAERVGAFFESDAVKRTRAGKPKAKPTIDKTRRVLRLALVWAAETGQIPVAPIPADVVDGRKARGRKGDDAADGKSAKGRGNEKGDGAAGGKDGTGDAPKATAKRRRRARKPRVTEVCLHDQEHADGEGGGESEGK